MTKYKYTFIEGEIWRDIPDWQGYYQASNMGRVRSIARTVQSRRGSKVLSRRLLSPWKDEHGQRIVTLSRDGKRSQRRVYVLVLQAFVGSPPKTGLVRIDKNPSNDRLDNLTHPAGHGNIAVRGQRNGRATISNATAAKIRQRLKKGEKQVAIARALKVAYNIVNDIKRGKTWTHIK